MNYTVEERRDKLAALMTQDQDCIRLGEEYWAEKDKFDRFVSHLPSFLRRLLFGYPTLSYLYHNRIITLMLDQMRFPEEKPSTDFENYVENPHL